MTYRRYWRTLAVVAVLVVLGVAVLFAGVRSQSLSPAVGTLITPTPSAVSPTTLVTQVSTVAPPPVFAASECTSATATTRQVIERYFALSTSNNPQAVTDCFAKAWRDKNQQYAAGTELWSHSGPANSLVVTPVDTVNGCDRFSVTAQMPNNRFWTGGQMFFSVGFEAVGQTQPYGTPPLGRMRIYETGTALLNASNTTLRCG